MATVLLKEKTASTGAEKRDPVTSTLRTCQENEHTRSTPRAATEQRSLSAVHNLETPPAYYDDELLRHSDCMHTHAHECQHQQDWLDRLLQHNVPLRQAAGRRQQMVTNHWLAEGA